MSLVLRYVGPVEIKDAPTPILDLWYGRLIGSRQMIYERLMTKIPDTTAFIKYLADPSAENWKGFVNPYFPDADLIKLKQDVKIHRAGPDWLKQVSVAFAPGSTFEMNVALKRDKFARVKYTLSGVGIRYYEGWGPEYKAVGAITGDKRIKKYIGAGEIFEGDVQCVFPESIIEFVRPSLIAMLTQGVVLATYAIEANLSAQRDAVINTVNSKIAELINSLKKPEYTSVFLGLEYDSATGKLYVKAEVYK